MRRILLALAGIVVVTLLAPVTTEAAIIQCSDPADSLCKPIGLFTWAFDDVFFEDSFTVVNLSDGPDSPVAGGSNFANTILTIDGVPYAMNSILSGAGGQADSLGLGIFSGVVSARVQFDFLDAPFVVDLSGPGPAESAIYAQVSAVPEPATMLLVATGLAMSARRRRRRA